MLLQRTLAAKRITSLYNKHSYSKYVQEYRKSIENPQDFWAEAASRLVWDKKWNQVLKMNNGYDREWFVGAKMNITYNCLDRHVNENRGDYTAVIYDNPLDGKSCSLTYKQLLEQVELLSGVLMNKFGLKKQDRVMIYMPMITENLVAMLACARVGLIHCVVFGGFSANQLAVRIKHCQANTIIMANFGHRGEKTIDYTKIVEEALLKSDNLVDKCLVLNRDGFSKLEAFQDKQVSCKVYDWKEETSLAKPHEPVSMDSTDPLYILYTSGTTGQPKGVVRSIGDYATALNWSMTNIYGCDSPLDTGKPVKPWWASSDFGWVVGHSYIAYAPLLAGVPTIIYEGKPVGTPNASQYFRLLSEYEVKSCFITPSAIKSIRKVDPYLKESSKYLNYLDRTLKNVFLAGERCDQATFVWIRDSLSSQIYIGDHWWQTESGWPLTAPCVGLHSHEELGSIQIGSAGRAVPGYNLQAISDGESSNDATEADEKELKRFVIKNPMPPGFAKTLWNNDKLYKELYFDRYPGYYDTMDAGHIDQHENLFIMSRVDDVINVNGQRLSSSALEEACLTVNNVVECAVVAVDDELRGHVPLSLVVVDKSVSAKEREEIQQKVVSNVREMIGPMTNLKMVGIVPELPKTRSGKIARSSLQQMANGKKVKIPITIEDATVYVAIYEEFQRLGLKPSNTT